MTKQQDQLFTQNLQTLSNLGFKRNKALLIIQRINTHIAYCIENEQDYDETLFFVEQDFTFSKNTIEGLMLNCMLIDPVFEEYYK